MIREAVLVAILAGGVGSVVACNPTLTAETPAPPGRTALFEDVNGFWGVKAYTLELSQGAAIAVTCNYAGPCTQATLTSDDPNLVEARSASLGVLQPNGFNGNRSTTSAFVIVGKATGQTHLHLRAKQGTREITVNVIPQPANRDAAAGRSVSMLH